MMLERIQNLSEQILILEKVKYEINSEIRGITQYDDNALVIKQKELLSVAEENSDKDYYSYLVNCINKKEFAQKQILRHKNLRSRINRYVDLVKQYEQRTAKTFNPEYIISEELEKTKTKARLLVELGDVDNNLNEIRRNYNETIVEIENIIGESKMIEKKENNERMSVSITGGVTQINTAFDNAKVDAKQNNLFTQNNDNKFPEQITKEQWIQFVDFINQFLKSEESDELKKGDCNKLKEAINIPENYNKDHLKFWDKVRNFLSDSANTATVITALSMFATKHGVQVAQWIKNLFIK